MKRVSFIAAIFFTLTTNAQNYLISFAGTGGSNVVNTVKVENLTKGTTLTLNGDDILHLTATVGISSTEYGQSLNMKIYPNPMKDNSIIEVSPPVAGDAVITIFDMAGRQLSKTQSYLDKSGQEFRLSGLGDGFYLITARGDSYEITGKLLCTGKSDGKVSLEKVSNNIQIDEGKTSKADNKGVQATIDMPYTTGDRLKFTSISGNFSTVITDIPAQNKTITFNFIACSDPDNNNYPVVEIGTQVWMAENLKVTKYRNGDLIGTTDPPAKNILYETTPKYQWAYDGNESNVGTYGRLYSWRVLTDSRYLCPSGWHVPTDAEWKILEVSLGMTQIQADGNGLRGTDEGRKMQETGNTHWMIPAAGTNSIGFTALPAGYRGNSSFTNIGKACIFWSSTESTPETAWYRYLSYDRSNIDRNYGSKHSGFAVRCLKD